MDSVTENHPKIHKHLGLFFFTSPCRLHSGVVNLVAGKGLKGLEWMAKSYDHRGYTDPWTDRCERISCPKAAAKYVITNRMNLGTHNKYVRLPTHLLNILESSGVIWSLQIDTFLTRRLVTVICQDLESLFRGDFDEGTTKINDGRVMPGVYFCSSPFKTGLYNIMMFNDV